MKRSAFSLVELLVVIGIIAVLIGILVPTVSKIRTSANVANSQQNISTLVSGIERYHADFRAYPGVFPNDSIGTQHYLTPPATNVPLAGLPTQGQLITMSESLVLSLTGGLNLNRDTTPDTFTYEPAYVGRGPASLNPGTAPKQFPAYIEASDARLGAKPYVAFGAADTIIPEFLDGFGGEPLPVLYLRARSGASGIVTRAGQDENGAARNYQYEVAYLAPYFNAATTGGLQDWGLIGDKPMKGDVDILPYFKNATLSGGSNAIGTPRSKDTYILIAAGKDRKYGTDDDITNFGAVAP
ncbi:MAG TPA: type II secretion system protein [Tepidisphaeraceae bacterium]|jgi:prepilin-type N-terminal cleavage/methylation domain-containing protein|nr:type II secretion system protein [Tepidisphaeraceae bacterium]